MYFVPSPDVRIIQVDVFIACPRGKEVRFPKNE
jgi:hypothetical protein